ncbi:MAG: adenylate/guanylate cyclase domain-containing protein [Alphaproteobacteria bacterium]|nr:adenylate/guanylate cyclase domain-containing protein [Alphaproteobacteria bacterium]
MFLNQLNPRRLIRNWKAGVPVNLAAASAGVRDPSFARAFRRAQRDGLALAVWSRVAVMVIVCLWLALQFWRVEVIWTIGLCVAFAGSGLLQWRLVLRHPQRRWVLFVFAVVDVLIVAVATVVPNPLLETAPPWPLMLKLGSFVFFFLLVAITGLLTSPALTLWTGAWVAGAWLAATEWIATTDGAYRLGDLGEPPSFNTPEAYAIYTDLFFVDVVQSRQSAIAILIVAGIVALIVARARGLVVREARAASERAVLARYFSPNVVDEISRSGGAMGEPQALDAAVLFVDVRGFTTIADTQSPEATISLLRDLHKTIADSVFFERGTLDKFMGDGAMALFGAPKPTADDARAALRTARRLLAEVGRWNTVRTGKGLDPIGIGIGIHYGAVVTGNAGADRRLDFTAIGTTVNLADRLERLTREIDTDLVISEATCERIERTGGGPELADLVSVPPKQVKGLSEPVQIRILPKDRALS